MKKSSACYLVICLLLIASSAFSQPLPGDPPCWPPPCVPIDGGLSLLIVAGAAYGGKKIYNSRKQK